MKTSSIALSHPNKILFPEGNVSKRRLSNYYERIAPTLIPYIAQRPVTLRQFPAGVGKPGFFRKHAPEYFPNYVKRVSVPRVDRSLEPVLMATVDEPADLKYFAGQNVVELHVTTAQTGDLKRPDQLVFDLDPSDADFGKVRAIAIAFRKMFDAYQIPSFVKLSGSRGVHIHVPLLAELPYSVLKPWTIKVAKQIVIQYPDYATMEHLVAKRHGRVYIDVLRNDYSQTIVAPYSVRAFANAPISAPIDWIELQRRALMPDGVNLNNIGRRLQTKVDPWASFCYRGVSAGALPFLIN